MMEKRVEKNEVRNNSFGTLSVGFGILSILFTILTPLHGVLLALISLSFAIAQKKSAPNSWSKSGLIISIIGLILNIATWIIVATVLYNNPGIFQ